MGVGIYYFYHGFGLKAVEGRHIRIMYILYSNVSTRPGGHRDRMIVGFITTYAISAYYH